LLKRGCLPEDRREAKGRGEMLSSATLEATAYGILGFN
jgi:hypothetical protein